MLQKWAKPTSRWSRTSSYRCCSERLGVAIPVTIVPNMKPSDMIGSPVALREVARASVRQE